MIEKLRNSYRDMVVYKDLKTSNFLSGLSVPSFMRDWLLKKFADEEGNFQDKELLEFIKKNLPRKEDWKAIKNRVVIEYEQVKFLAKILIDIDTEKQQVSFSLPDFGLSKNKTIIELHVWDKCKHDLLKGETWGVVELGYIPPIEEDKTKGKIKLISFKPFCPYSIDIEYFKEARQDFTINEWLDVLLGAVDYNANGYQNEEEKLTMLSRLLPFVEKNLNMVELAPKGTGKSYLFGNVSRFGWLVSGGKISRAKMFYDLNTRAEGLVTIYDFVTLDEIQTIKFTDKEEMESALKGYMQKGSVTIGNYEVIADCGIMLCGNIKKEIMDEDGYMNMFTELPPIFHESAFIERFHGFIKGWDIPRMNDDLKISGWALNSEYFCMILHDLREDISYRATVDKLIEVPKGADTRNTEAIKKLTTAYLKLLFPHVKQPLDITEREFKVYCLNRAKKMRETILLQLRLLDKEYQEIHIPKLKIRKELTKSESQI